MTILKKLNFFTFFAILLLLVQLEYLESKWLSFPDNYDQWNEGLKLLEDYKLSIKGFDSNSNICFFLKDDNDNYYYTVWDGKSWKGLSDDEITKIDFLNSSNHFNLLKYDSEGRPHFTFIRRIKIEAHTIVSLFYIFFDGEKWSDAQKIVETDSRVGEEELWDVCIDFVLNGSEDVVHFVYTMGNLSSPYWHLHYRYMEDGLIKTLGDGDTNLGVFKEIPDSKPNFPIIQVDSRGHPYIACTMIHDYPDMSTPRCLTYWNGSEWAGIGDSQKISGLPYSTADLSGASGMTFKKDDEDKLHFVFPGKAEDALSVLYMSWDGERWSGLKNDEDYTILDMIEYPFYDFLVNFTNKKDFEVLCGVNSLDYSYLRYYFWDGNTFSSKGGSNREHGLLPSDFLGTTIYDFKSTGSNEPITLLKVHWDLEGEHHEHYSALMLEEEVVPTIELYVDNFEHSISAGNDVIKINGRLHNPLDGPADVNLIIAMLPPGAEILYFPGWSTGYISIPLTLPAGFILPWSELLVFDVPSESPPVNQTGTYYFGIFVQDVKRGDFFKYDIKTFHVVE